MKAILMFEDGKSFFGEAGDVGAERIGEVIMNTAVVGYQEMMTDPGNAGKILVLTYPLIGNYGIAPKFNESQNVWLAGLVIKEQSKIYSNWQAKEAFSSFIKKNNLLVISELDTRTLAVHLRQKGQMQGIISTKSFKEKELLFKIENFRKHEKKSLLPRISVARPQQLGSKGKRIAVLDLGATRGLLSQLESLGFLITLLPYNTSAQKILQSKAAGLVISSGPEEDPALEDIMPAIKNLIGKIPILGIALGSQLIAKSLGAKIKKMHLGHHGVNYPIRFPPSLKGEITVQNHSWVVDLDSLKKIKDVEITALHLNDNTVEGFESKKYKILAVQYYPSSPGLGEINSILTNFAKLMKGKN